MKPEGTIKLTAVIDPVDADNKKVSWSSSDNAVASVDQNGNVTALTEGLSTITVTTEDGGKTSKCEVDVTPTNN